VRRRTSRRSIWILVSVATLAATFAVAAPAPVLAAPAKPFYSIQSSSFKVAGSPYAWSFSASRSGSRGPWSFSLSARRTAHAGKATQSHSWSFNLPATDIAISANLATVRINTRTALSKPMNFGSIVMRLTHGSKLHTVVTKCKKNGKVLFSSWTRSGKLAGAFDFKPNAASGLPTNVKKTPIGAKVTKFVNTNATCPGGGGGGGGGGGKCTASKSFGAIRFTSNPTLQVSAIPTGKTSFMSFSESENPPTAPAISVTHSITVSGPASATAINATSGNVTLNGGVGTPFLSNTTVMFTGGAKSTLTIGKCKFTTFTDAVGSAGLTVNFDTGAQTIDGSPANALDSYSTNVITKA
jgi:hypothetical protein